MEVKIQKEPESFQVNQQEKIKTNEDWQNLLSQIESSTLAVKRETLAKMLTSQISSFTNDSNREQKINLIQEYICQMFENSFKWETLHAAFLSSKVHFDSLRFIFIFNFSNKGNFGIF